MEGEKDKERLVRVELPDGEVQHYEGDKGKARLVRQEFPSGTVHHFEGEKDKARLVRVELSDGNVKHYEGERGKERLVRVELVNDNVKHLEGEKGKERIVQAVSKCKVSKRQKKKLRNFADRPKAPEKRLPQFDATKGFNAAVCCWKRAITMVIKQNRHHALMTSRNMEESKHRKMVHERAMKQKKAKEEAEPLPTTVGPSGPTRGKGAHEKAGASAEAIKKSKKAIAIEESKIRLAIEREKKHEKMLKEAKVEEDLAKCLKIGILLGS